MNKIIITGGLGHIGSFLIKKIFKEKKNIHLIVIDNLSSQRIFSLFNLKTYNNKRWMPLLSKKVVFSLNKKYSIITMKNRA